MLSRPTPPPIIDRLRGEWVAPWWPVAFIVMVSLAIRSLAFGNPILDYDEQLYLLVGDGLHHGLLPYVDLWDRKPVGLFLFYAAIRSLGGTGIVQYQIVGALCATGCALLIWWMARRAVGNAGAITVAIAYVEFLQPLHGQGGQAAVLYNVPMALAAAAAFRANDTTDPRRITRFALAAMALCGIAIQFKYTPVVEGTFLGCYFLARLAACGASRRRLTASVAAMVALALAPTLGAIGWYAAIGHLDAFVQANFQSVFQRGPFPPSTRSYERLLVGTIGAAPLLFGAVALWRAIRARDDRAWDRGLMIGWAIAALIGFGMLGDFYDFYFITAMPPLLVLIAARFPFAGAKVVPMGWALLLWPLLFEAPAVGRAPLMRERTAVLVDAIRPYLDDRRLMYVYDGPAVLYLLTGTRSPSRFVYPDHLTNPIETKALGVDPVAEERRLLATRPAVIVSADRPLVYRLDRRTREEVRQTLERHYGLVARVRVDRLYSVWAIRDEASAPVPVRLADVQ